MDVGQYLGIFLDESQEHIQALNDNLLTLEQDPENEDSINEIFRAAHSLKGMAGTMGYKRLQRLTHDTEDVFSAIRGGSMKVTSNLIDILFQALDAIQGYVDTIRDSSDEGENDNESIIAELNKFLSGGGGDAAPAEAAPAGGGAEAAPAAEGSDAVPAASAPASAASSSAGAASSVAAALPLLSIISSLYSSPTTSTISETDLMAVTTLSISSPVITKILNEKSNFSSSIS